MTSWWLDPNGDDAIRDRVAAVRRDIPGALLLARELGAELPQPGSPGTLQLWDSLARAASVDLTATRAIEPHLDAVGILAQAGIDAPGDATFGVYAAEGPGVRLEAHRSGDGWELRGTKAWCSLAGEVSHCLVTAWVDDDNRGLFLTDLRQPSVQVLDAPWISSGLSLIPSGPVQMGGATAMPVGAPGWYLTRPGFAWGGIGVAAIWYGAAVGVATRLRESVRKRSDDIALMHLGACDSALLGARAALRLAADEISSGAVPAGTEWAYAVRVRDACAQAAEAVLRHADHAMGPGPLTSDDAYARLVDDLRIYVRQHHAERDQLTLGRSVLEQQ